MLKAIKRFIRRMTYISLGILTLPVRRDRRVAICLGWKGVRFADNARYMYLYLTAHKDEWGLKRVIWLTRSEEIYDELSRKGYDVCREDSLRGVLWYLRAKYIICDQLVEDLYYLTHRAVVADLWHGMPLKRFGMWTGMRWEMRSCLLLTCSAYGDRLIGKAFDIPADNCFHGLYPRDYYLQHGMPMLLDAEERIRRVIEEKKREGKKILFYLPTFRENGSEGFMGCTDRERLARFFRKMDDDGCYMVTKLHFYGAMVNNDSVGLTDDSLLNIPPNMDIYPFLSLSDMLITDYSSVMFDYLFLDRPIICFAYDLDYYVNSDRGLLVDYDKLPALFAYNIDELEEILRTFDGTESNETMREARRLWRMRCFSRFTIEDTVRNIFEHGLEDE